ncbi:MAG: SDR family oxidoreductase [Anaerolineae bacterium]|nr:SDR family oxidoreductase [Anaerolineae bacterium]
MESLSHKTAIVTGGGRGIGREICLKLAMAGADVLVADIDLAAAQGVAAEINSLNNRSAACRVDVTSKQAVLSMVETCVNTLGRLDILVNNAGVFPIAPLATMSESDWDRVIAVNLKGVFLCCQAALPAMRQANAAGRIINMASVSGLVGAVGFTHYAASKAGVIGFTRALAREVASMNITVNAIAPGIVDNEMTAQTFPKFALDQYLTQVPLRRLTLAEDVAEMVVFLASSGASYLTGQTIAVDGGYTMH